MKTIVRHGIVTEEELAGIYVWYRNGKFKRCWLGWYGLDGTGDYYKLKLQSGELEKEEYQFYIINDYYRIMNKTD